MSTTPFSQLLEQAKEAKFTVVPAGWYGGICTAASATRSSTDKPMIKLSTKIVVGPHAGAKQMGQQTLTKDNPVAVAMFLKFLNAFGLDDEFLASLPPTADGEPDLAAACQAMVNRPAMFELDVHEWNEEDRNGLQKFRLPDAQELAEIEAGLAAMGQELVTSKPKAAPADPFAAAAASNDAAAGGTAEGGLQTPDGEAF